MMPLKAELELLPHQVGTLLVFGLDGSFVASAYSYPIGASRQWFALDAAGNMTNRFAWPISSAPIQSSDGMQVIYAATDPQTGRRALFVRDLNGAPRLISVGDLVPTRWVDAFRVLVDDPGDHTAIYALDTRTGTKETVMSTPPPHPTLPTTGNNWINPSGDLRWALIHQLDPDGSYVRSDLYDVTRHEYVSAVVPGTALLAPRGDIAVWLASDGLRGMHLCDRREVTLAAISAEPTVLTGMRWSPDGRYFSVSLGPTDETHGPQRDLILDFERGVVAQLDEPWGYIQQWAPRNEYVAVGRIGYHAADVRLARLIIP